MQAEQRANDAERLAGTFDSKVEMRRAGEKANASGERDAKEGEAWRVMCAAQGEGGAGAGGEGLAVRAE